MQKSPLLIALALAAAQACSTPASTKTAAGVKPESVVRSPPGPAAREVRREPGAVARPAAEGPPLEANRPPVVPVRAAARVARPVRVARAAGRVAARAEAPVTAATRRVDSAVVVTAVARVEARRRWPAREGLPALPEAGRVAARRERVAAAARVANARRPRATPISSSPSPVKPRRRATRRSASGLVHALQPQRLGDHLLQRARRRRIVRQGHLQQ